MASDRGHCHDNQNTLIVISHSTSLQGVRSIYTVTVNQGGPVTYHDYGNTGTGLMVFIFNK